LSENFQNIAVMRSGYVGMWLAILFSQQHNVNIIDIEVDNNLESFRKRCGLILTIRTEMSLNDVQDKLFTKYIFKVN
jgi:UDP-glucose 6-dehydrogenase